MFSGFDSEITAAHQLVKRLGIAGTESEPQIKNHIGLLDVAIDHNKKIIVVTGEDAEQHFKDFKRLCHDNPKKTFNWVSVTPCQFTWQQLYDPNFYVKRQLKKIALKKVVKAHLIQPEPTDLLVFSGLCEESLYKLLEVTEEEKAYIAQHHSILSERQEAESKFNQLIAREPKKSVHWFKLEEAGDNRRLVWERSHDPLVTQKSPLTLKRVSSV